MTDGMRWSRTDTNEDFDEKLLTLSQMFPLSGKGFYSILRNLIYSQAPKPFTIDQNWPRISILMPRTPRRQFDKYLAACLQVGLFDPEIFQEKGELTSKRIEREIRERFGDMARSKAHYNRSQKGRENDREN